MRMQRRILTFILAGAMGAAIAQNVDNATTGKADDSSGATSGKNAVDEAAAVAKEGYGKDVKQLFAGNC
jgi:hypothetical protein